MRIVYLGPLHKTWRGLKLQESLYCLQSEKVVNKTNFTASIIKSLPYSTPRALAKICEKLISRKLILRDATQLKAKYSPMKVNQRAVLEKFRKFMKIRLVNHKTMTINIQDNHYLFRCTVIGNFF